MDRDGLLGEGGRKEASLLRAEGRRGRWRLEQHRLGA